MRKNKYNMMDYALGVILLLNFVLLGLFYQEIQVQQELMRQYMEQYELVNSSTHQLLLLRIEELELQQMTTTEMSDSPSILKVAAVSALVVVFILLGLRFFYPPELLVIDGIVSETLTRLDTVNEIIINTGSDIITNVENRHFISSEQEHLDKIEQQLGLRSDRIAEKYKTFDEKAWDVVERIHNLLVRVRNFWGNGPGSGYDMNNYEDE